MQRPGHLFLSIALFIAAVGSVSAQQFEFGYQGNLDVSGSPANGDYDFEFALFDVLAGGVQVGSTLTRTSVAVAGGVFGVKLDFGSQFPGANRFLEIRVRPTGGGAFTLLVPRQQISASPYSIRTISATTADALSAACVDCVQNAQISSVAGSKITGTIPVAAVPAASTHYIQNTTSPQAAASFNIAGNGTAASMNVGGALTQSGSASPGVAPAGQGRIYFDAATNKVKVSENGAAFVNLVGATGVSGSGTVNTIPLFSAETTLSSSLISQDNGVVRLPNVVALGSGGTGGSVSFGAPNGETGMLISGTNRADIRFNGSTLRLAAGPPGTPPFGGIGIETSGVVRLPSVVTMEPVGTGGQISFAGPAGETGISIAGANGRADIRFDGVTLKLNAGPAGGPPANGLTVSTNAGNIGMGTTSPVTRLSLNGGPAWTANGWTASMNFQNGSAFGWEANASGQRFGVGQSTNGLYFFRTFANFGQNIPPANYVMQITDNGHIIQDRGGSGLVKAMIVVNPDGTIARCYNGITGSVAAPCGFSVNKLAFPDGDYLINFGFQVTDRFYSLTSLASAAVIGNIVAFPNANSLEVATNFSVNGVYVDSPFSIIVY